MHAILFCFALNQTSFALYLDLWADKYAHIIDSFHVRIPREAAPIKLDGGGFHTHHHLPWLERRMEIERSASATSVSVVSSSPQLSHSSMMQAMNDDSIFAGGYAMDDNDDIISNGCATTSTGTTARIIEEVLPDDVLFGKDRRIFLHPGNQRLRSLVDANMQAYLGCNRTGKAQIARSIVKQIQQVNGRFLKRGDNGVLEEVSVSEAQAKVAHAFRNRRKK
jgi:hypothetical protein